jgi:DNA repair exonuclease SbcCD nuclease subunit
MRIAHTSDWHLGHRRFDRLTPTGINVREADVARSFSRLVDALIIVEPDVILVAGDVFDQVRPSNHAVVHALNETARLRAALPNAPILMLAGNHDAPKQSATGSILPIFAQHDVRVVDRAVERIRLGDLSVLCVPEAPGIDRSNLVPDSDAPWNVLLMHGQVEGSKQAGAWARGVTLDDLEAPSWNLVALGDFHDVERLSDRAFYCGAIDLVSSNVWKEQKAKGFLVHEIEDGSHEFIELPASRTVIDLPLIYGRDLSAADLDALIAEAMASVPGGYEDAVVRLVVADVSRETSNALDWRTIKRFRARCLSFQLDLRKPERESLPMVIRDGRRRLSLEELATAHVAKREIPPDVDRAAMLEAMHRYVADAYGEDAAGPAPDQWTTPEPKAVSETAGAAA